MLKWVCRVPVAGAALAAASFLVPAVSVPSTSGAAVAGTATTLTAAWSAWEGQALAAVAGYRGNGTLTTGQPGAVVSSSVATPSGPLAVAERSVSAQDGGGDVLVQMTVLGQTQVVVTERGDTTSGQPGATLVLRPGSSAVAGTYPLAASGSPATEALHRGSGRHDATDALVRHAGPVGHRHHGQLTVTGGCHPIPAGPFVVSTTFGPLVDGLGETDCGNRETLSLIVSIYRGLVTHVGTTTGSSSGVPVLSWTDPSYYFCKAITGTHAFRTSQIWAVNGTDEGGATSVESWLHCT